MTGHTLLGEPRDGPAAYLFICRKPGKVSVYVSLEPDGSDGWPWDEWRIVERISLVEDGKRATVWPGRVA
jgi:hypothetical protein